METYQQLIENAMKQQPHASLIPKKHTPWNDLFHWNSSSVYSYVIAQTQITSHDKTHTKNYNKQHHQKKYYHR